MLTALQGADSDTHQQKTQMGGGAPHVRTTPSRLPIAADEGTVTGSVAVNRTHCLLSWAVRFLAVDGTALRATTVEIDGLVLLWEGRFPHTLAVLLAGVALVITQQAALQSRPPGHKPRAPICVH